MGDKISSQVMANYTNAVNLSDMMNNYMSSVSTLDSSLGSVGTMGTSSLFGYGYGTSSKLSQMYNDDPIEYAKYQAQIQAAQLQSQTDLQAAQLQSQTYLKKVQALQTADLEESTEVIDLAAKSKKDEAKAQAGTLAEAIKNNQQDQASIEYTKLRNMVETKFLKAGYRNMTPKQIDDATKQIYTDTTSKNIVDDFRTHGDDSFTHGFKKGIFGVGLFTNIVPQKSCEDNISDISGKDITTADKVKDGLGTVVSLGLSALAIYGILKHGGNITHAIGSASRSLKMGSAERALANAKSAWKASGSKEARKAYQGAKEEFKFAKDTIETKNAGWESRKAEKQVERAKKSASRMKTYIGKGKSSKKSSADNQSQSTNPILGAVTRHIKP